MTPTFTRTFRLGEFHEFYAGDTRFAYIVPAGAIFELDGAAAAVLSDGAAPGARGIQRSRLLRAARSLAGQLTDTARVDEVVSEMLQVALRGVLA